MSASEDKRTRGRPKTLDRTHILDLAMTSYWGDGVLSVSLNELCRRAGVSKPAIYREFGSEDNLKAAALAYYYDQVLAEFHKLFRADIPFDKVLDLVVDITMGNGADPDHPAGCLFVVMTNSRPDLGANTQTCLTDLRRKILSIYSDWFERAQERGDFTRDINSEQAAYYLHAQISNAMNQKALGEPVASIRPALDLALSVLR